MKGQSSESNPFSPAPSSTVNQISFDGKIKKETTETKTNGLQPSTYGQMSQDLETFENNASSRNSLIIGHSL